ncbi:MAG TPA: DUF1385 domain-containing protein [Chloroflexota bacterium]|nr:DUF1385 domain-containing protein [Chloroflexota bacterium]
MDKKENAPRYGGRALRNGVMMVGPKAIAVAVRKPDGTIETAVEPFEMRGQWAKDIPFVRGLVSFVGMLGMAKTAGKLERQLTPGRGFQNMLPQLAPGLGVTLADRLARELGKRSEGRMIVPIEALTGVAIPFLAFGVSGQMPGVRELWRYHGAEHKAVNAAEAGLELTAVNAQTMSRVHPRCGTVMAFWGLLGGMIAKGQIERMPNGTRKAVFGALSGPLVMATAYEAVRLGAQLKDHPLGKWLFSPAWQTQRLTTAEPGEDELEVAVAALQAVIDFEKAEA